MESPIYKNERDKLNKLLTEIKEYSHLCIYSAGNRAKEIVQMQKIGFLELQKPSCFLVTGMQGNRESIDNPEYIDDIPVYVLSSYQEVMKKHALNVDNTAVFVVAMEHYHQEISDSLSQTSFKKVFFLTDMNILSCSW